MKLYHYTSLASFLGIIRKDIKLVFWGSRYDCMNDPLDFQFSRNRILPTVKKNVQHPNIVGDESLEVDVEPYIVSFSKKKDDFLMWRMYNSKVALVLDSKYFDKPTPNTVLSECLYIDKDGEIINAFNKVNKKLPFCRNIFAYAGRGATFIKHKSFESEGEVRLATWDYYDKDNNKLSLPDCKDTNEKKIETRVANDDKIVLYKEFEIDGNALVGVIIHTYSGIEFESISNAIKSILIKNGFSKNVISNIKPTNAYPFGI